MENTNLSEYEQVRKEILNLKDCVTNYMGFVLGGTGLAIFGFTGLGLKGLDLAYSSALLSVTSSLVLVILFYKFLSHNRYAGYAKILSAEVVADFIPRRAKRSKGESTVIAWEICVERLRVSDTKDKEFLADMVDHVRIKFRNERERERLKKMVGLHSGRSPTIDSGSWWRGIGRLVAAIFGYVRTNSWAYPPYVASIFFIIITGFLSLSGYAAWSYLFSDQGPSAGKALALAPVAGLVFVQAGLWASFCGKLYRLMAGSGTVSGFYWRMLVLRAKYLNESEGVVPEYAMMSEMLADAETAMTTIYKPDAAIR